MSAVAVVDIIMERGQQEAKFPGQHLPSWSPDLRELTWSVVLGEEAWGVYNEASADPIDVHALRRELVQVAAVALRWIEDLDRCGCEGT